VYQQVGVAVVPMPLLLLMVKMMPVHQLLPVLTQRALAADLSIDPTVNHLTPVSKAVPVVLRTVSLFLIPLGMQTLQPVSYPA